MIQISNSDFFLFLHPWSVPFIMNQPNICFYMFIICIFMHGQFWTLEHSPSHCSSGQFWTRTISPVDSSPFQFGNTSHWSLDSYTTPMDPPDPPPPPTTSQGGGSAPSPPKIDKLPKIYIFRKEKPSICFTHLFCRRGGVMKSYTRSFPPPPLDLSSYASWVAEWTSVQYWPRTEYNHIFTKL